MVRNRGKKALYEVMSKARAKSEPRKTKEHIQPAKPDIETPAIQQKGDTGVLKSTAKWWRKPRIVQLNAGRIEFSMPYQIAVVLFLGFIFVVIAAYRLGQASYPAQQQEQQVVQQEPKQPDADTERPIVPALSNIEQPQISEPAEDTVAKTEVTEPVEPTGNNVIVLVQYDSLPDLAPVQEYFRKHHIELEIVPEGGRYFLQTKQRYDNPSRPGTDGYRALQKIKEIGKEYQAPKGYGTFAPNYFQDAYGKKVK
jgi:hypothetical protein